MAKKAKKTKKPVVPVQEVYDPTVGGGLKPTEEMFCQYYVGIGQATFGNAVASYMLAYDITGPRYGKRYNNAKAQASLLLTKPNITARCNIILKSYNTNGAVDVERAYIIAQRGNLVAKVMGIKSYDELMGRITKKVKVSGALKSNLNDKQMALIAEQVIKKSKTIKK